MNTKKILVSVVTAILVGVSSMVSPAVAHAGVVVNQGDKIFLENSPGDYTACTVGYVHKGLRTVTTAGHCGGGRGLKAVDQYGNPIGVIGSNTYNRSTNADDVMVVNVNPNVGIGGNRFSGDGWAHPSRVRMGDQICSYGAKSGKTHCGFVTSVNGRVVKATRNSGGINGDSGGPAWIPGKGFVGIYTTFWQYQVGFTHPR